MSIRRNVDEQLRRLEREAARGDRHAVERLRAARLRSTGVVAESHRIGVAELGVFTSHGDVLCLTCAERLAPDVDPGVTANARCDRCGAPVRLTRDDVALLQNLRDELRVVHGINTRLWQTGGMCVALGLMVGQVEVMIAVDYEGHSFVCDRDRIVAGRSYDQPQHLTHQGFGFPPGAQWVSVPTGMLEWSVGAIDQDGVEADDVLPGVTFRTRTVGEAAHLIARHFRRTPGVLPNPPVGHFLDSVESAITWALENVGDACEDYPKGSSSRAEAVRQHQEEEVAEYVAEYAKVMRAGLAPIWRAIEIPRGENPRLWIDWDELGTHWSFRRSGAGVYSGGKIQGPTETVVIEAKVMANDIDWEYGFTSFWYYGTEQFECALKEGSTVEVTKVSGRSETDLKARANPHPRH